MTVQLEKELFVWTLDLLAARMQASSVDAVRRLVKESVLSIPRVKTVYADAEDKSKRLLLLAEHIKSNHNVRFYFLT